MKAKNRGGATLNVVLALVAVAGIALCVVFARMILEKGKNPSAPSESSARPSAAQTEEPAGTPPSEPASPAAAQSGIAADRVLGGWTLHYRAYETFPEAGTSLFEADFDVTVEKGEADGLTFTLRPTRASINGEAYEKEAYSSLTLPAQGRLEGDVLSFELPQPPECAIDPFYGQRKPIPVQIALEETDGTLGGAFDRTDSEPEGGADETRYVLEIAKR